MWYSRRVKKLANNGYLHVVVQTIVENCYDEKFLVTHASFATIPLEIIIRREV